LNKEKLLLVELNEVPYKVLDTYAQERPRSNLARLMAAGAQYDTVTEDKLALDPWISWATLHRGVNDEKHQILHLGQVVEETDQQFPPVWRTLREHGLKVGVFGSLHSSNLPPDVAEYDFYLPDYFDAQLFAHPAALMPFQELNLAMTRQSARNVTRKVPLGAFARFLATAPSQGLTLSTVSDSISHLAREAVNHSLRIRRRAYQPLIMADLFLRQMERSQPDFATFYTNHVAAAMHRYWGAMFPQDYDRPLDTEWINAYAGEIRFAMDKFDIILGRLMKFVSRHPAYTMLVASSMGQAAIPSQKSFEFLTIMDLPRFMEQLGVPRHGWQHRPAMVPCHCVMVNDEYRDRVVAAVQTLEIDGVRAEAHKQPVAPMSYDERQRGFFQFFVQFDSYRGQGDVRLGSRSLKLAEMGLGLMAHEEGVNCTAQHVPGGSLLVYRSDTTLRKGGREPISTVDVVPSILRHFGVQKGAHLHGNASIPFVQ